MIEAWIQYTCDGCGMTEYMPSSNVTKSQTRKELKEAGWKNYGQLDYCPLCVKNGNAKNRVTDMNS